MVAARSADRNVAAADKNGVNLHERLSALPPRKPPAPSARRWK
jgi:hypothetical protein